MNRWSLGLRSQPETVSDAELQVDGTLPEWVDGSFVLNGPGQFEVGGRSFEYWFDPFAMLRLLDVSGPDGTVRYTNRYVDSQDYRWALDRGGVRTAFPGTPPDRSPFVRFHQLLTGQFTDNTSIGTVRIGGDWVAVTESPWGHVIDSETLETGERIDLTRGLPVDATLGHVHVDPETDEFWGLGLSYGPKRGYVIFKRPANTRVPTMVAHLPFRDIPYVHSFSMTERYLVLPATPYGPNPIALLTGSLLDSTTFIESFERRDGPARFHIVDRQTGNVVATPEADPFFVYHHANAFEDGDEIVVDAVVYPDDRAITGLYLDELRTGDPEIPPGRLVRFRLPLDGRGAVTRESLHDGPVEFPTINYRGHNGRPYRYVYLAEMSAGPFPTGLLKFDAETRTETAWTPVAADGGDAYPSEATFVPRPGATEEDDGVLLTVVLDPATERSVFVVLDAETMTELARATLPHWTPYPFHGQFYDRENPTRTMH